MNNTHSQRLADALGWYLPEGFGLSSKDEQGEHVTCFKVYPTSVTDEEIVQDWLAHYLKVDPTECHHTYDCCGGWYSSGLHIATGTHRTLAYVTLSRNV